ncbi:MAG: DUF3822 family protein [Saprospiraceae bacterium]
MTPSVATSSALRMVVGLHGISLLVKNESRILALKSWQITGNEPSFQALEPEMRRVFGSERLFDLQFETKSCALSLSNSTLVPSRLFDPENLGQYFQLLLRVDAEQSYGFEKLDKIDCYLVWVADKGLTNLCGQYFSTQNIRHTAAPLILEYQNLAPAEGYAVFANLCNQKVQIAVFERQNLVFFNAFNFGKPSDLLYYVLLAYKQFDLNPLDIPLTLSGTLLEDSEIFRLLLRYIRPMRFPPLPAGFQLPSEAKTLPAHYWFDLTLI